jgi:hypothetical protein
VAQFLTCFLSLRLGEAPAVDSSHQPLSGRDRHREPRTVVAQCMLYPPDRKVGDWPRQRHVPSIQVQDSACERVSDGGVHRAAVRIARTEHEVVDEHLRVRRRTKTSPTNSTRPVCWGGARRRRGDTPLRGRGPPRVESCAWLRRKGRGWSRRIPARATFAAARCSNAVRWTRHAHHESGTFGHLGMIRRSLRATSGLSQLASANNPSAIRTRTTRGKRS